MCSAASEALNRVDWGFAPSGSGVVAEHVATGALDQGRAVATVDKRNLATKHVHPLFGGPLRDEVPFVDVGDEHGGGVLPREYGVTLPVGGSTYKSVGEAGISDEGMEKIFR
jgi:hypothetical protein